MMKLNEPIGNSLYAPFIIRSTLGGYCVAAGIDNVRHLPAFVEKMHGYHFLPNEFATLFGILIPYTQVAAGTLLIVGIWTTLAAFLAAALLIPIGIPLGGISFAKGLTSALAAFFTFFTKDCILFAAALSLLYSGAGAFSVDRFRKSG
jgi:uncharacterized membrane protein YphA (DoxX/SURF4 family)